MNVKDLVEKLTSLPLDYVVMTSDDGLVRPTVEIEVSEEEKRVYIW